MKTSLINKKMKLHEELIFTGKVSLMILNFIRKLKHARFWDGNRKWSIFTLNLPSHDHIHINKYLFSIRVV